MTLLRLRRSILASAFLTALSLLFLTAAARANGRFPIADQLIINPTDPSHMAMRTTYGFLQSTDAGKSWKWVCENVIGYGGYQDPAIGITGDGTILAGVFEGLSISHDRACSWAFAGDPLTDKYVIDNSVERGDPARAVAITSNGTDMGYIVILAETTDNGKTWTQAGIPIATDFIALTVDVAPSRPQRVYVSGLVGMDLTPALEWSDDRGMTWNRVVLPMALATGNPYFAAVDPNNPDRVYLRISGDTTDRLLFSSDGAQTWAEIFSTQATMGDLLGFALSPDGTKVAVGGPLDGIHVAATSDHMFQPMSQTFTRCLTWSQAGLYACANEFKDGFTLGLSTDEGKTFEILYHLKDICPLECPAGSAVENCAPQWPMLAETVGADPTCGKGSGSSASSSGGLVTPVPEANGACGCHAVGAPRAAALALAVAAATFLAACKRRRRIQAQR